MKSFTLLLLTGALIQSGLCQADVGYYSPGQLPSGHVPKGLSEAANASVKIQIYQLPISVGQCSGSVISNSGYVLTAFHCVMDCLISEGKAAETAKDPRYSWVEALDRTPGTACSSLSIPDLAGENARVVATGRGYSAFDDTSIQNIPADDFQKIKNFQDDWAILKFDFPKQIGCIRPVSADQGLKVGDAVWAIGFPGATSRPGSHASDGKSQFVSYGSVDTDETANEYLKGVDFTSDQFSRENAVYAQNGGIVSDLDTSPGDSGSMMINADGKLVGMNIAVAVPDPSDLENAYFRGVSVGLSTQRIMNELSAVAGSAVAQSAFDCKLPASSTGP